MAHGRSKGNETAKLMGIGMGMMAKIMATIMGMMGISGITGVVDDGNNGDDGSNGNEGNDGNNGNNIHKTHSIIVKIGAEHVGKRCR